VTVIDTTTLKVVGQVATGNGHHELEFSSDNRFAFVTNEKTARSQSSTFRNSRKSKISRRRAGHVDRFLEARQRALRRERS
jgi:DNA-binding beta-propeller fold protein YncE